MRVRDLMQRLEMCDPEAEVVRGLGSSGGCWSVETVSETLCRQDARISEIWWMRHVVLPYQLENGVEAKCVVL